MITGFADLDLVMIGSRASYAAISECERYRYVLGRQWDLKPSCTWVMLNPSTADAAKDDATIRKCMGFARKWGFGGIVVVNLFAWRSRDPKALIGPQDPVGSRNASVLARASCGSKLIVAGWGKMPSPKLQEYARGIAGSLRRLQCFGVNSDGSPKHPLYIPYDRPLVPYVVPAEPPAISSRTRERFQRVQGWAKGRV